MLTVLPPAGGDDKHDRIVDAKPRLALLLLLERPRDPLRVIPAPQGCGSCERNRKKPRPEGCEAGAGLVTHEHHPPSVAWFFFYQAIPWTAKEEEDVKKWESRICVEFHEEKRRKQP